MGSMAGQWWRRHSPGTISLNWRRSSRACPSTCSTPGSTSSEWTGASPCSNWSSASPCATSTSLRAVPGALPTRRLQGSAALDHAGGVQRTLCKELLAKFSLQRYLCTMDETNDLESQPSSTRHPGIDHVLTSESLKSLAHPLRVRIYDELSSYGPMTASGLAERLGESSGSTSYHLRQLERTGLVREDQSRGKGRERWWERTPGSIAIPDARSLPPGSADRLAVKLVEDEWFRSREQNFHEFVVGGEEVFGAEWLDI